MVPKSGAIPALIHKYEQLRPQEHVIAARCYRLVARSLLRLRYAFTWQAWLSYTRLAMPSNSLPQTGHTFL